MPRYEDVTDEEFDAILMEVTADFIGDSVRPSEAERLMVWKAHTESGRS